MIGPGMRGGILIVEDEALVGMLIEDLVMEMGFRVSGVAASVEEALEEIARLDFDAAILDVNLRGLSSAPVADALKANRVPFIMATGYGTSGVPPAHRDV